MVKPILMVRAWRLQWLDAGVLFWEYGRILGHFTRLRSLNHRRHSPVGNHAC
jgi:hypothetical protein